MADYEVRGVLSYTKEDTWAKLQTDGSVLVGITDYAQQMLGRLNYVDLPEAGNAVTQMQSFASIESAKATADVYAPVSGIVKEVNEDATVDPEIVNNSPYDAGWLAVIEPTNLEEEMGNLLDAAGYKALLAQKA
jgi:glycine cleavage system H protein